MSVLTCKAASARTETSLVNRLDPRTRVLAAPLFAVAVVACQSLTALGAALGLAVLLALLARLAPGPTLRRLLALEGFMLLVLASLPFTVPGEPVFGPMSAEGLRQALGIALKANAVVLATLALLGSMECVTLGRAMARLGVPERFCTLMLFTIRYVDVLHREYARLRLAMRARGFRMRSSVHCWQSLGWLVGMLMVGSLERADRIHAAMRCRGFSGRLPLLDEGRPGALDWGFGAAQAASVLLMAWL